MDFSDCIFHFFHAENLPVRQASSPKEFRLRSYTVKCVRFASQRIKDLALATLDLSTLADVALCCLDDSAQSTSYWVELLSLWCLQVKPTSSCLRQCTEILGCRVCDKAVWCRVRSDGYVMNQLKC